MFEAHITIDPVFEGRRELASDIAKKYSFKMAKLLMEKEELSRKDSFMTGHDTNLKRLQDKIVFLVKELRKNNFTVLRYKIEVIIMDSRQEDSLFLINYPV